MHDNATPPTLNLEATNWHERLDRAGATASLLCAVHCLLAPLLAASAAAGVLVFFHHELENAFILISLALGASSLGWGYLQHRRLPVLLLYLTAGAAFLAVLLHGVGSHLELQAMVAGGLLLASAHLLNRRFLAH